MRYETIRNDFRASCRGLIALVAVLGVASGAGAGETCPSFPAASPIKEGNRPVSVAVADLDGDGIPDVVSADSGTFTEEGGISVLLGNGDGSFQAAVDIPAEHQPYFIAVADLDGDDIPDLVTANRSSGEVSVLLGNGDGSFRAATHFAAGDRPVFVTVADLDGDNVPDLVVGGSYTTTGVSVLLGNGDGSFQAPMSYPVTRPPYSVAVGDLDGDGIPDLVAPSSSGVSVLLGNGDGTFEDGGSFPAYHRSVAIAMADFDGDSIPDLVTAGESDDRGVSVLLGNGDGSFRTPTIFESGGLINWVVVADLNGDNVPDIVGTREDLDGVSVLLGKGDASFEGPIYLSTDRFRRPKSVAAADLDGDSIPDLVIASEGDYPDDWGGVSVLLGNGNGTFQATTSFAADNGPISVAVADLDGDAVPDLVTANYHGGFLNELVGNGDGSFQTAIPIKVDGGLTAVAVADLNGDGAPDLVATSYYYPQPPPGLNVLLGNGDGTFQPATVFAAGHHAVAVAVADLNGDNFPDVVIGNNDIAGVVNVLLGNGDGSFQAAVALPAGIVPKSVAVADLDGDGVPDIVAAGKIDTVSVLRGNGDGSFQDAVLFATGVEPNSIAVADVDGDVVPDLVTANYGPYSLPDGDVSVLLGNGDGTFQAPASFAAGRDHSSVAVGDLDGDGIPDLVVADIAFSTVSVLLGNGDGSFQTAILFGTDRAPASVALADLDRDGALDAVTGNVLGDSVTVLVNQCDPPARLVDLDIKPGSDRNAIPLADRSVIPVAILGSETFDVADVDATTLRFGPGGAPLAHLHGPHFADVNGDGVTDLLAHFRVEDTGIAFGDRMACLTGETLDGQRFKGCDSIRTVPDMDGDSLLDIDEAAIGTNALRFDSDGDGYGDGTEVLLMGTDPLNPLAPKPVADRERRGAHKRRR